MGQQLASVSPTCLPVPPEEELEYYTEAKVEFGESLEGPTSNGKMCKVRLPEGWGIYETSNRGDIWHGYLVNAKFQAVSSISWMSKGSYDNECSMEWLKTPKQMKLNAVCLKNGWIMENLCEEEKALKDFIGECNKYAESQYRGAYQTEMDSSYQKLLEEYKKLKLVFPKEERRLPQIEKLVAQNGKERQIEGPLRTLTIAFQKPYFYSSPSLWAE